MGFFLTKYSMSIYSLYTLVDITPTGVTRGPDSLERGQQRNWETVLQAVGLVAQPTTIVDVGTLSLDLKWCEFGEYYEGEHRIWNWKFSVEREGLFTRGSNEVAVLEELFEQVPIICGLEETARFMLPIFHPYGGIKNIYFMKTS